MQPMTAMWRRPFIGAEWLFLRKGPGATNHFEGGGFVRSNDEVAYPNLMFHFLPIAIRYDGSSPAGGHGYQVHVGPMYSDARGSVKITSTDPRVHPALRFNYLSTEQDRREWVEAIRVARDILNQPAFEPFNGGELSPGPSVSTPTRRSSTGSRRDGETALHPSCTCRMGVDDDVRRRPAHHARARREGLRVVDASVMPYVTNGNIYAPVMMLAEKAADLILGNTPLEPSKADVLPARARRRADARRAPASAWRAARARGRPGPRRGRAAAARGGSRPGVPDRVGQRPRRQAGRVGAGRVAGTRPPVGAGRVPQRQRVVVQAGLDQGSLESTHSSVVPAGATATATASSRSPKRTAAPGSRCGTCRHRRARAGRP